MRIEPTVGRIVWFYPTPQDSRNKGRGEQPLAAIIVHVNDDATLNLNVNGALGGVTPCLGIPIAQSDDDQKEYQRHGMAYAAWMPYQKGQAARTEQVERAMQSGLVLPPAGEPGPTVSG